MALVSGYLIANFVYQGRLVRVILVFVLMITANSLEESEYLISFFNLYDLDACYNLYFIVTLSL